LFVKTYKNYYNKKTDCRKRIYTPFSFNKSAARQQVFLLFLLEATFSSEMAVLILAEFIRSPDSSFEQLSEKISRIKNVIVNPQQIERLFDQHGLKKTMETAVPVR